jgi:hypothetical protein
MFCFMMTWTTVMHCEDDDGIDDDDNGNYKNDINAHDNEDDDADDDNANYDNDYCVDDADYETNRR